MNKFERERANDNIVMIGEFVLLQSKLERQSWCHGNPSHMYTSKIVASNNAYGNFVPPSFVHSAQKCTCKRFNYSVPSI